MQFRLSNHTDLVVGALDELPVPVDFATEQIFLQPIYFFAC